MPTAKPKIEVTCYWCGKTLHRPPWYAKREQRHFCDNKCRGTWQKTQTSENARAYKAAKVSVQCSQCGKRIKRDPDKIRRNEHFFCDQICYDEWRKVHMRDEGNPNFSTPAIETNCALCDKPIRRKPWKIGKAKRTRHFCCPEHRTEWCKKNLIGPDSPNWKGGSVRYYGPNWHSQKSAARKRDGYCCQVCGITQKKNRKSLDVHHIIPFRAFNYAPEENENYLRANDLSNLISLCRNCHMKVEAGLIPLQFKLL